MASRVALHFLARRLRLPCGRRHGCRSATPGRSFHGNGGEKADDTVSAFSKEDEGYPWSSLDPPSLSPPLFSFDPHSNGGGQEDIVNGEGTIVNGEGEAGNGAGAAEMVKELADASTSWFSPVADSVMSFYDFTHTATGAPWWLVISGSAFAFRMLLLPLTVIQMKKVAEIASMLPSLEFPMPFTQSEKSFQEQYATFKSRHRELRCPSFFWFVATPCVQAPLFITIMYSLRRTALEHYPGLNAGGMLWFVDLTAPGHGYLGAVLPLTVAAAYYTQIQVSFNRDIFKSDFFRKASQYYKVFLELLLCPMFVAGYFLPSAVHMFWAPHAILTASQLHKHLYLSLCGFALAHKTPFYEAENYPRLVWKGDTTYFPTSAQTWLLKQPQIKSIFMKPGSHFQVGTKTAEYQKLLQDAGQCFSENRSEEALRILQNAVKIDPTSSEAYSLLGYLFSYLKQWPEAAQWYQHALSRAKTDEALLAAQTGYGIALLKQGKIFEGIDALKAIGRMGRPKNPAAHYAYYYALRVLGSALYNAGSKIEALDVHRCIVEYDPEIQTVVDRLQKEINDEGSSK